MKISKTKIYEVTFSVVAHEETEGGMNSEFFADAVSLEDALDKLDMAKAARPREDWFIKVDASAIITGAAKP